PLRAAAISLEDRAAAARVVVDAYDLLHSLHLSGPFPHGLGGRPSVESSSAALLCLPLAGPRGSHSRRADLCLHRLLQPVHLVPWPRPHLRAALLPRSRPLPRAVPVEWALPTTLVPTLCVGTQRSDALRRTPAR